MEEIRCPKIAPGFRLVLADAIVLPRGISSLDKIETVGYKKQTFFVRITAATMRLLRPVGRNLTPFLPGIGSVNR
jgi:hypothetical protein